MVEQRVKADHQRRTWIEGRLQLAAKPPADAMLDQAHGGLQVGRMVGGRPQPGRPPRDRAIEGSQAACHHALVTHRVEAVDLEGVRMPPLQGRRDRLRRRPVPGAGVRKKEEQPF